MTVDSSPLELSQLTLERLRTGEDDAIDTEAFERFNRDDLAEIRTDPATARAFWINLYNACTQHLLHLYPTRYESTVGRLRFFRTPCVTIAGAELTLDDIQHGILRDGKSKYGLGYLPRLVRTGLGRSYRLSVDPRIHFALNCGSNSCPPIRFYSGDQIDEELDMAAEAYLQSSVTYDAHENVATVPRVMLWYRGDFGGPTGMREVLERANAIPAGVDPDFNYHKWDWTKAPSRFVE